MCGRFAVTTDPALLAEKIKAIDETTGAAPDAAAPDAVAPNYAAPNYAAPNYAAPNYAAPNYAAPNYNVAPTSTIATVVSRHTDPDDQPTRRVRLMRWGLVPPWVKAAADGAPETKGPMLINARADKVTTSPAFRSSAKSKRCLIPMDGYYEWRANPDTDAGKKSRKTPFFMYREDGEPLFMAGLWSVWKPAKDSSPLLSCTIITTDAPGELAQIHDRMPLMLRERDWDRWLDPDTPIDDELLSRTPDVHDIRMREVSTLVNSVRNNGPELLEPAEPEPEQMKLL